MLTTTQLGLVVKCSEILNLNVFFSKKKSGPSRETRDKPLGWSFRLYPEYKN
jgi:hypothetical protein